MPSWFEGNESELWARYGLYADLRVRDDEIPLRFEEWYVKELRLAGEQDELF